MPRRVLIVDYGLGNLFSLQRAFKALGAEASISADPAALAGAERAVLPGVGAFGEGMSGLRERRLLPALEAYRGSGRALFGVCLGMQLLLSESDELGKHPGLGYVPGRVVRFADPPAGGPRFKIPHIGWNVLERPEGRGWDGTLLRGLPARPFMYFVHSFHARPERGADALALTSYGLDRWCSVLQAGPLMGCQAHPELSGDVGLHILKNFLEA